MNCILGNTTAFVDTKAAESRTCYRQHMCTVYRRKVGPEMDECMRYGLWY